MTDKKARVKIQSDLLIKKNGATYCSMHQSPKPELILKNSGYSGDAVEPKLKEKRIIINSKKTALRIPLRRLVAHLPKAEVRLSVREKPIDGSIVSSKNIKFSVEENFWPVQEKPIEGSIDSGKSKKFFVEENSLSLQEKPLDDSIYSGKSINFFC